MATSSSTGMRLSTYKLEIIGANKEILYTNNRVCIGTNDIIEFPHRTGQAGSQRRNGGRNSSCGGKKMSKEEIAKATADNAKIGNLNELIKQAQAAMQQQNWADADKALTQLIAADPDHHALGVL